MIVENVDKSKPYVLSGNNIFISNSHYSNYNISLYGLPYSIRGAEKRDVTKEKAVDTIVRSENIKKFMLNQIEKGVYSFNVAMYSSKDVFYRDTITINDIVNHLNFYNSKNNKNLLTSIRRALDKKNILKKIYFGRLNKNNSFLSIIKILKEDPEIFKRKINNNMYKNSVDEMVEIISPIDWEEFTKAVLSEEERETIKTNVDYLLYNYQKYEEMSLDFDGDYVDFDNLKPEIIEMIEQDMPEDLTKTEKAYFAYRRICQMFSFDECSVFSGRGHWNPKKVDDLLPGDVVTCNDAIIIFCKYLEKENIPYKICGYNFDETNKFNEHLSAMIKTDEMLIHVDLANRQLKNDISASKCLYPTKWFRLIGDNYKAKKNLRNYKKRVDEILDKHYINENFKIARELIEHIKGMDLRGFSIKEKIELATDTIAKIKMLPIDMMELIDDLTKFIFGENNPYFDVKLIVKKPEHEEEQSKLVLCIASNENGVQDDYENNTYTIIREGNIIETVSWNEMSSNIGNNTDNSYRTLKRPAPGLETSRLNKIKERKI